MHLEELKSKNQTLESKLNEYEDKLKNTLKDHQQLLDQINNSKNIGKLKNIIVINLFN